MRMRALAIKLKIQPEVTILAGGRRFQETEATPKIWRLQSEEVQKEG
jgi:hypothetical protein